MLQPVYRDQHAINLYDEYTHQMLSRQDFLHPLSILDGGTASASTFLPPLQVNYLSADVTREEGLFIKHIGYPGIHGNKQACVARPKGESNMRPSS